MAASPTSQSTGVLAAGTYDGVYLGKNIINGVIALPGATVTIYDNTTATGKIAVQVVNDGTSSLDHVFNLGIRIDVGLSILVSGTTDGGLVFFGAN